MKTKDYYELLGVARDASEQDINRAYRKLALKYHPDKNKGDANAEERFKEISEAYSVLSDQEKRRTYDQYGSAGLEDIGFQGFRTTDDVISEFGDLFSEIFGGPRGRARGSSPFDQTGFGEQFFPQQDGENIRHTITIDFLDAVRGGKRELRTSSGRTITVTIPAGIDSGSVLKLAGQGAPGQRGGRDGDLLLKVEVSSHPDFTRAGLDVHSTEKIPLRTAILGGTHEVRTVDGKKIDLKIPAGTSSGHEDATAGSGHQSEENGRRPHRSSGHRIAGDHHRRAAQRSRSTSGRVTHRHWGRVMAELTDREWQQIRDTVERGRKIEAIKLYRELTGEGLKEAKTAIDAIAGAESGGESQQTKSGCGAALLIGAALVAWAVL